MRLTVRCLRLLRCFVFEIRYLRNLRSSRHRTHQRATYSLIISFQYGQSWPPFQPQSST